MRGATCVTLQPHQILRLPCRKTRMLNPDPMWNVIYNARSNRCHDPTSPNTAPATKNDTAKFERKTPKTYETSFTTRGRSEHDPRMIRAWNRQSATRLATEVTCRALHEHFLLKNTTFPARLSFKNSPSAAPATKSDTWTSPSAEPATRTCHENLHSNLTKCSAWHAKWLACLILKRHLQCANLTTKSDTGTSPTIAPATKSGTWTSLSDAPAIKSDTWTSPSAAPATKKDDWTSPSAAPATKSDDWTSPSAAPATKSDARASPTTAPVTKSDAWASSTLLYSTLF